MPNEIILACLDCAVPVSGNDEDKEEGERKKREGRGCWEEKKITNVNLELHYTE